MKRLIVILALLLSPVLYGQEYVDPYANAIQTGNLVPDSSFDGPTNTIPNGWTSSMPPGMGGSIQPSCGALSNQGKCFVFSYAGTTLSTVIDLSQYETNNFEFYFDFFYRMNCNNSIGGYCENPDGPRDLFGASVQFFTTNGEAGAFNFIPIGPDYFKAGDPGVNEFDYRAVGWYSSQQSEFLFTSAIISFYGQDTGFWAGPYGPALDRVNFSIGYLPPPEPTSIGIDCTLYPFDPTCVIDTLNLYDDGIIDYSDPVEVEALADATDNTGNDDGSDDGTDTTTDEETVDETLVADTVDETNIEEMLTDEEIADEVVTEETIQTVDTKTVVENSTAYRELTDEEKAALLADAISKSVIESALTIAENATNNINTSTTTESTATRTTTLTQSSTQETFAAENKNEERSENTDTGSNDGTDILEIGRSLGQQALAATQQQTDISATDSITQAETIAISSNVMGRENDFSRGIESNNDTFDVTPLSDSTQSIEDTTMNIMVNVLEENNVGVDNIVSEDGRVNLAQYGFTDNVAEDDTKQFEDVVVNNSIDINGVAFLGQPNVRDLEMLGVIGKQEEKSDAEKRAEEVVAANKEQQDEINKNYMEADQSGIVAAMADGTDVSSYRTAMIPDLSGFYKPEEIYKGVVYKDNARGMYFLEKGNTDTYKKMVEEQYK